MPEISIIVPVYNVEQYLERCIESILAQTFTDFELILVNDGSTDGSLSICNKYLKIDKRIKVLSQENKGLSSARNMGIANSKGKYIAFVDSDDFINEFMYEVLYSNLKKYNADIAICGFEKIYDDNILKRKKMKNIKISEFSSYDALKSLYENKSLEFIVAWNKLYRKNIFEEINYPIGKIHEDEFIAHKIYDKCNKVIYIDEQLYYYYQRSNSIMKSDFTLKRFDAVYAYKNRMEFFREKNYLELLNKAEYFFIQYFFMFYFKCKNTLNVNKNTLKQLKRTFTSELKNILRNPKYNWKEKSMWIVFCVNENLYEKIRKRKEC